MAQLQLYTTKNIRGLQSIVNINPTDDVLRQVHEFISPLKNLQFDPRENPVFIVVKHISRGLLLTVLRPIDEALNYYASTLFLPHGVIISTGELLSLIDTVKDFIESGDPSQTAIADMRSILAKDYPADADKPLIMPSSGHHHAIAFYGGRQAPSLHDYIGSHFYQPEYSAYASVVLIDSESHTRGKQHAANLTKAKLDRLVRVNPPKADNHGFAPYLGRRPFDKAITAGIGSNVEITWHKSGFEPLTTIFEVKEDNSTPAVADTSMVRRVISPASFHITAGTGTPMPDGVCLIKVNGETIDSPKAFSYSDLRNARVEISAPGFSAFSGHYDLASTMHLLVPMRSLHKTYRFQLPLQLPEASDPIKLYIKTKKKLNKCPIEGYEVAGGELQEGSGVTNTLIYSGSAGRNTLPIIAGIAGLIIGLLLGWLIFHRPAPEAMPAAAVETVQAVEAVEPVSEVTEATPAAVEETATQPAAPDYNAAIEYLDSNKMWQKAELEAIPGMEGFYDDINAYNFENLSSKWAPLLEGSKSFAAVLRAVEGSACKRDPRTSPHNPTFTQDGEPIGWRSYTYWIDP